MSYELIQVAKNTFYIDCPVKMGVYRLNETEAILIDSGNDKDAGKKILKIFAEQGWNIAMILNTHSHGDHIGGNQVIQQRTSCPIYGAEIENCFIQYPFLEPAYLYGGYPYKELRNKFLMAAPSKPLPIAQAPLPDGFEILDLSGHSFAMIGIKTPDNICFMADCVSAPEILEKYHIPVIYNVEQYLSTLCKVKQMEANLFIPSHTVPTESMENLVECNQAKISEIEMLLSSLCKNPTSFEELLSNLFTHYSLTMDFNQSVLVGNTLKSYLTYMKEKDELTLAIENNQLLWTSC